MYWGQGGGAEGSSPWVQLFLFSPDAFAMALKCSGRLSEKYLHRQHCLLSLVILTIQLLFDVLKNFVAYGLNSISKYHRALSCAGSLPSCERPENMLWVYVVTGATQFTAPPFFRKRFVIAGSPTGCARLPIKWRPNSTRKSLPPLVTMSWVEPPNPIFDVWPL